jgi:hypothetical protein
VDKFYGSKMRRIARTIITRAITTGMENSIAYEEERLLLRI